MRIYKSQIDTMASWYTFMPVLILFLATLVQIVLVIVGIFDKLKYPAKYQNQFGPELGILIIVPLLMIDFVLFGLLWGITIHSKIALFISTFVIPLLWFEIIYTVANRVSLTPHYFNQFQNSSLILWGIYTAFFIPSIIIFGRDYVQSKQ